MKWDVVLGITSAVGLVHALFFIAYFISTRDGDRKANVLLACIFLSFALRIFKSTYYAVVGYTPEFLPVIGLLAMSFTGPLLLLYGKRISRQWDGLSNNKYHFVWIGIPLLSFFVHDDLLLRYGYLIIISATAVYMFLTWQIGTRKKQGASTDWLRTLIIGFLFMEVVYVLQWSGLTVIAYIIITLLASAMLLTLSYLSIIKYKIIQKVHHYRVALEESRQGRDRVLAQQLRAVIMDPARLKDPSLSVARLAKELSISPSRVSTLIQLEFGKSFSELLIEARLQFVVEQLKDLAQNEKIEMLAYDAGFQSPSAFYSHFKKAYKMKPSQYRMAMLNQKTGHG
jgi:AraC-like DNA-binding protein